MKTNYECVWALQCSRYNAEDPCEKPSNRIMKKPACYIPKNQKEGLISRLSGKIMKKIMRFGESTSGGVLED